MPYLIEPERLEELLPGEPGFRADQLRRWLYRNPVLEAGEMTNLPKQLRARLVPCLWPFSVEADLAADRGATRKWLGQEIDAACGQLRVRSAAGAA